MYKILCFGDSNTWGYSPDGVTRYDKQIRWPGVLQTKLGADYLVVEEGFCGRTTVFDDPEVDCRNGIKSLPGVLKRNTSIDMFIIMLGTNDLKNCYHSSAADIPKNIDKLIQLIIGSYTTAPALPEILVIAPPPFARTVNTKFMDSFNSNFSESKKIGKAVSDYFTNSNIHYYDSSEIITSSERDGIHLEPEAQIRLGEQIATVVKSVLSQR